MDMQTDRPENPGGSTHGADMPNQQQEAPAGSGATATGTGTAETGGAQPSAGSTGATADAGRMTKRNDGSFWDAAPFTTIRRVADQVDEMIDRAGLGRGWLAPVTNRNFFPDLIEGSSLLNWRPEIEVFRQGDDMVVRVDLPGMTREDVSVRFVEGAVVIEGERRSQHEEHRHGYYHSERHYGRFSRQVAIPRGVNIEDAHAAFRDGVLEITITVPEKKPEGRSIQIN